MKKRGEPKVSSLLHMLVNPLKFISHKLWLFQVQGKPKYSAAGDLIPDLLESNDKISFVWLYLLFN
jgi:hypothetical protein